MDNKPQIPTLKESQKNKPLLKIKGLAGGGMSLMERLKQFKKKDLAFILAGLGVLFMAPLAEHFMMSPENGSDKLGAGFSSRGGAFGNGSSPYEGGVNGMAPGSPGGPSDVITPLNVRDPSALVMGPGATQQAPAAAPQASSPPPPSDNKWNDAIAAGKAGASAATKKASLPVPKVPLSAGGLRGLGAAQGGSGSSFSLAPISAANVPNRGNQSDSLQGQRGSGIKGVARGPGSGGNSSALDALKNKAEKAGGDFNRSGSAASALESAANRDMSGQGGGGAGEGSSSPSDKAAAQSSSKDSKSPGESLEFLRLKQEQEKAIDLKWKLKEKEAMLWPNLKEKLLEEAVMTPFKALTKGIADAVGSLGSSAGSEDKVVCTSPARTFKRADVLASCDKRDKDSGSKACWESSGVILADGQRYSGCNIQAGAGSDSPASKAESGVENAGRPGGGVGGAAGKAGTPPLNGDTTQTPTVDGGVSSSMASMCNDLQKSGSVHTQEKGKAGDASGSTTASEDLNAQNQARLALRATAGKMGAVEALLTGQVDDMNGCGGAPLFPGENTRAMLASSRSRLRHYIGQLKLNVIKVDTEYQPKISPQAEKAAGELTPKLTPTMKPEELEAAKQTIKTLNGDPEKLKPQADAADKAFVEYGKPDDKWSQLGSDLGEINTRLQKATSELSASRAEARGNTIQPTYSKQIDEGEGGKWQQVYDQQHEEYVNQKGAYDTIVAALQPNGGINQGHTQASAALRAGAAAAKDITPLLSAGNLEGGGGGSFDSAVYAKLKEAESQKGSPTFAAAVQAAATETQTQAQKVKTSAGLAEASLRKASEAITTAEGRLPPAINSVEPLPGAAGAASAGHAGHTGAGE